jgi:hypothetical protein
MSLQASRRRPDSATGPFTAAGGNEPAFSTSSAALRQSSSPVGPPGFLSRRVGPVGVRCRLPGTLTSLPDSQNDVFPVDSPPRPLYCYHWESGELTGSIVYPFLLNPTRTLKRVLCVESFRGQRFHRNGPLAPSTPFASGIPPATERSWLSSHVCRRDCPIRAPGRTGSRRSSTAVRFFNSC